MTYNKVEVQKKITDNIDWKSDITTGYLSDIFKEVFGDRFFLYDNIFYCYNNIYWEKDNKQSSIINNFIDKDYYRTLIENIIDYEKNFMDDAINNNMEKSLIKAHTELISKQKKSLLSLRSINYREGLVKDIKNKLYRDDIIFDKNPYLFCFKNKLFDLTKNKFIEPLPEYYISMTTGYNFIEPEEEEQIKLITELNNIIDTIFFQEDLKTLYLTILSTGMCGVPLEKFIISNGSGGNGKGLLNELVQRTIGDYAYILPSSVILNNLKQGGNPEIFNMNNKRLVICREPDSKFKINCATIKELVGGTELNARTLYSDKTTTNLCMTFIMECNEKPKLNETSDALSRRIIDIPFKARFVDKKVYDKLNEEQKINTSTTNSYYKTIDFKEKYKIVLFLILKDYFYNYHMSKDLLITDEILKRNDDYMKESDEMICWLNENYETTTNEQDIIDLKKIYDNYRLSDKYINSSKEQKRLFSYRQFVKDISNNPFLKLYFRKKENVYEMFCIKENNSTEDNEEDITSDDEERIEKQKAEKLISKINSKNTINNLNSKSKNNNYNYLDEGLSVSFE
jgi:phage/plasmid-associated DNA primase